MRQKMTMTTMITTIMTTAAEVIGQNLPQKIRFMQVTELIRGGN